MPRVTETKNQLMQDDSNKVAIVTGGGSGLGLAIARKFVDNGIVTIITGRTIGKLEAAKEQLGNGCHAVACDIADLVSIPPFVDQVYRDFGRIDILVNNAGINMKKAFTEVTDVDFQQVMQTNVNGLFAMSREVVKKMLLHQSGSIINISSMAAQYGIPKVIAYSAAKTAVDGMTRAMAVELSPKGIRVNAIAPGFIYSEMTAKALDSDLERKAKALGRTPMGIMGEPTNIADAAWFLATEASSFITGVVLPVDGGNSIGF